MEMEHLKHYLLARQQQESTFHAMCPLPPCFEDPSPHVPSNPNPPCDSPHLDLHAKNHHPNPPKTSSLPRKGNFSSFLAKCKEQDKVRQSPRVIPPIPSHDLPPKNDIKNSSSPLDLSISPSNHSAIPQDPFIPPSPSHDPLPNQDQGIPCTTDSTPSHELASVDPPFHAKVPSTPSPNIPPCQDQIS